ncbi:MAG: hypothetical protein ACLFTK_13985, partial [Anaerolineales bacterium]
MRRYVMLAMLAVGLLGCDPLAPDVTQEVIIVTNEAAVTATPIGSGGRIQAPTATPVIQISPSPTPTQTPIPTTTVAPCTQTIGTFFESS